MVVAVVDAYSYCEHYYHNLDDQLAVKKFWS